MKNYANDYLSTSQLSLVAVLRLFGHQIESTERFGRKVVFKIKRTKDTDSLIKDFWDHNLKVDPLDYFNSIKETKSFIYQNQ